MLSPRSAVPEAPSWGGFWPEIPIRIAIDPNGNLTQKTEDGQAWEYVWNAENQLTRVTKDAVEVATFKYDPIGRRIEKVAGGATRKFTYDSLAVLRETSSLGGEFQYIHGPLDDEPLAWIDGGEVANYFHADGNGTVVGTSNQSGSTVQQYRYTAWGEREIGSAEPGYAFTGREWDPETGLYYFRARYYDPDTGRFISADPIGLAGEDPNLYAYVGNSPTTFIDPLGLLRVRVTYQVKDRGVFPAGETRITPKIEPVCAPTCDDKWELKEFRANLEILMLIPSSPFPEFFRRHEAAHARVAARNFHDLVAPLEHFEGLKFDSYRECREAARRIFEHFIKPNYEHVMSRGQDKVDYYIFRIF